MTDVSETLAERGSRYGEFPEHARVTQNIKRAMQDSANWTSLSDDKKEALEMVARKVGRILNGDPEYADSWHDIIGYTKLVEDELGAQEAKADDGPVAVTVRVDKAPSADLRSTLYVKFDGTHMPLVIKANAEYRVEFVSEISFSAVIRGKSTSVYFSNEKLSFSQATLDTLKSHIRYYS